MSQSRLVKVRKAKEKARRFRPPAERPPAREEELPMMGTEL